MFDTLIGFPVQLEGPAEKLSVGVASLPPQRWSRRGLAQ